jgi:hypothetical protein
MKFDLVNLAITSVISLVIGILISRHFASRRKIAWTITRRRVLDPIGGNFPSNVKVFFDDHEVKGVTEWRFGLWNSGNRAITSAEITSDGAVGVKFAHETVLKTTEPAASREGILKSVTVKGPTDVKIQPDLLDVGDAVAFTIYTTGDYEQQKRLRESVSIEGHVLNMPRGFSFVTYAARTRYDAFMLFLALLFYAFAGFWAGKLGWNGLRNPTSDETYTYLSIILPETIATYLTIALGAAIVLVGILFFVGVIAVVIVFVSEFFNRPPEFIHKNLNPSDGPRGRRSSLLRLFKVTYI